MARPLHITIKLLAAEIGRPAAFNNGGGSLGDFLSNSLDPGDTPAIAVAKILEYFCIEDGGGFNGFMPGVKLAIATLDETLGRGEPEHRAQLMKDLKGVLDDAKDRTQIDAWVKAWGG